ncbi:MAG: LysM peptidoglycan-binding domain-containing M23 family metallopeptidase [Halothece sp. Uz-M2-17]|nr:LysM peptidoglycan-binding domain-containing M23 family metallopeptidase [Halothece sp. Uz-M2-17]
MATLTLPLFMVSLVIKPVGAWEIPSSVSKRTNHKVIPPQTNLQPRVTHQIQPGDTLWELAQSYQLSAQEIAEYNGIELQQLLQIGDTLEIPIKQNLTPQTPQLLPSHLGAIGGGITSENIVTDSETEVESIPPVPQVVKPNQFSISEDSQTPLSEVPIQQFLADVKQLRANYEKESGQIDNTGNVASENQGKVFSPVDSPSRSSSPNSLATAPIKVEFYNPSLSAPIGETVSPKLPPLSSPEQYLPNRPQRFNGYIWPAEGVFTSGYGMRWGRMHRGIDIAAPIGTPILAAAPGEVVVAGWSNGGYGNLVKLKHPDGSLTLYAHNNKLLVHKGQEVDQGQQIAEMGSTGRSTGPHLHFEIHPAGKGAKNPLAYLPNR